VTRLRVPTWLVSIAILGAAAGAVGAQQLPAVSGPNGKLEFDAGALSLPTPTFVTRAAGTLTLPVGTSFGLQFDANIGVLPGFSSGGAVHLFTRDPASYLIGGALGIIQMPGALVAAAGPEAELYFDRWTLEAWAGVSYAHPAATPDRLAPFVMTTLAYYPSEQLRLSIGLSSLDGYNALHLGTEYQFTTTPMPLALLAAARIGQDGAILATLGLKAYLGPPDKSLIRRHREDDPVDLGTSLYASAGGRTLATRPAGSSETPPPSASYQPPPSELPSMPPPSEQPSAEPPSNDTDGSSSGHHPRDPSSSHHPDGGHHPSSSPSSSPSQSHDCSGSGPYGEIWDEVTQSCIPWDTPSPT
jgi:hypothetical protein